MNGVFTGFVGACVEAWAELRIHRTRVLLSLIGVAVAVTALTTVVGLGAIAEQATIENYERSSGRPATLNFHAYNPATRDKQPDPKIFDAAFNAAIARYEIDWSTRGGYTQFPIQFIDGVAAAEARVVDVDYGTMHRIQLLEGRWFTETDEQRLAPAMIINEVYWNKLGSPDLRTHPTVPLAGRSPTTAVVIGVTPSTTWETYPTVMMLFSSWELVTTPEEHANLSPSYEAWVPPDIADELTPLIQRDIAGTLGEGWQVDVNRQDYLSYGGEDPLLSIKLLVGGVAILVLLLGALGLVNISLVTVRQRIREIGIRRSFGATAGRVFFAVMMESIVATMAAGVIGVMLAVAIVSNPIVTDLIGQGVTELPAFPIEAAFIGLGTAAAVGALAGLLPALVAVRVKVIDAIRY